MSITVSFTDDTPLAVLSSVVAFGMHCQCNETVYTAAKKKLETELPSSPANLQPITDLQNADPVANVAPVPIQQPAPAPQPQAAPAPVVPLTAAPSFTAEQVGRAGSELISAQPAKMPELMALLSSYGVQAITDLTPEQLGPFATALRGMGARI